MVLLLPFLCLNCDFTWSNLATGNPVKVIFQTKAKRDVAARAINRRLK
jgi:hypothetical protein